MKSLVLPSTGSISLASRNLVQTDLAISLAMENVVVVVVVTIRDGSFGSGIRFDWENLREPRFVIASSVVKVCSTFENRTRCAVSGRLTMSVEKRSLKSCHLSVSSCILACMPSGSLIVMEDILSAPMRWCSQGVGQECQMSRNVPW